MPICQAFDLPFKSKVWLTLFVALLCPPFAHGVGLFILKRLRPAKRWEIASHVVIGLLSPVWLLVNGGLSVTLFYSESPEQHGISSVEAWMCLPLSLFWLVQITILLKVDSRDSANVEYDAWQQHLERSADLGLTPRRRIARKHADEAAGTARVLLVAAPFLPHAPRTWHVRSVRVLALHDTQHVSEQHVSERVEQALTS